MPGAADKYREAIDLYRTTDLTIGEISRRCGVTRTGLSGYIYRCHRDLMLKRNGISGDPEKSLRKSKGQRPETRAKYRAAIEACDSEEYIHLNISQIARKFHLDGTALANQLRAHYPDVMPRREAERRRRGIADNTHRGVRKSSEESYADAVTLLRDTDKTIEEVARECGVSFTGLRQHLLFYHKDLVGKREDKRKSGKDTPKIGKVAGNGKVREMSAETAGKYAEGVELYRSTTLPVTEIARRIGVNVKSLRNHLTMWHRDLMFERRGAKMPDNASDRPAFDGTKRYNPATLEKYAEAIALLKSSTNPPPAAPPSTGTPPPSTATTRRDAPRCIRPSAPMENPPHPQCPPACPPASISGPVASQRRAPSTPPACPPAPISGPVASQRRAPLSLESVAKKFGFNPDVFRAYIKEHEPALFESLGMITLPNGRQVLRRSYEKYRPAIEAYSAGNESLKTIAARFGLTYNSLTAFIRRNHPELLEKRVKK